MTWDKVKRKDWAKTKSITNAAKGRGKKLPAFRKQLTAGKRTRRPR